MKNGFPLSKRQVFVCFVIIIIIIIQEPQNQRAVSDFNILV